MASSHTNSVGARSPSLLVARAVSGEGACLQPSPRASSRHDQSQVHAGSREFAPAHGERAYGIGAVGVLCRRGHIAPTTLASIVPSSLTGRGLRAPGLFSQGIRHRQRGNAGFGIDIQTVEHLFAFIAQPLPSHLSKLHQGHRTRNRPGVSQPIGQTTQDERGNCE